MKTEDLQGSTPEERWLAQKERMLAWLRLGFSVVAILVTQLTPEGTTRLGLLSHVFASSFCLYSLAVVWLIGTDKVAPSKIGLATTCLDLIWISLIIFSTGRIATPFFPYYLFPVITASSRYGIKGGLITSVIGVIIYWSIHLSPSWEGPLALDLIITRSIYLVGLGYIFGFVSQFERKQNKRLMALYKTAGEAAKQEERRRIAHELHDQLLQTLATLALRLETCRKHLLESPTELTHEIHLLEKTARSSINELREFLSGKDSRALPPGTLIERLREDIRFLRDGLGLTVIVESTPEEPTLPAGVETQVYYVMKEALMNIARHSHASRAEIHLKATTSEVQASIADDGVGFHIGKLQNGNSFGLSSMRERIEKLGGNLSIATVPAQGTKVSFRFPVNPDIAST